MSAVHNCLLGIFSDNSSQRNERLIQFCNFVALGVIWIKLSHKYNGMQPLQEVYAPVLEWEILVFILKFSSISRDLCLCNAPTCSVIHISYKSWQCSFESVSMQFISSNFNSQKQDQEPGLWSKFRITRMSLSGFNKPYISNTWTGPLAAEQHVFIIKRQKRYALS